LQTMGVEGPTDFDVEDASLPTVPNEDQPLDTLVPIAMAARPDIVAANRQIDAARLGLKANYGAFAPTLTATGRLSDTGTKIDLSDMRQETASFSLNATWSLFAGG